MKLSEVTSQAPTKMKLSQLPASPAQNTGAKESSFTDKALQTAGNIVAGGVRGAGSIGATIVAPYDIAKDALAGKGLSLESNRERRQQMDEALTTLGADTDSLAFKGGKLGAEIAGTLPVGGLVGKAAQTARAPQALVSAISTGGMKLNTPAATTAFGKGVEWLSRVSGGAITGGAQAALVDPDQAKGGAIIGGALPVASKAAGVAGDYLKRGASAAITNALGALTGTSAETVSAAFNAGKKGATEFLDNMRGKADFGDVVDAAKQGLATMREARANAYRSGMVNIKNDKTILDFAGVDKALNGVVSRGRFKNVSINKKASEAIDDLKTVVDEWRNLDPAQYHTPEGFDALKQAIGDIQQSLPYGSPGRNAADQVYNGIKAEINKQAPSYARVMKDYETASTTMLEIEKALSLGKRTSKDTAIRKLQSLMRNNAQTNYGNRLNLASELEEKGGVALEPAIAGQAMNSLLPRGMVGALEKFAVPSAGIAAASGVLSPAALAISPLMSPRMVGEGAYLLGRGVGGTEALARSVSVPLLARQPTGLEALGALSRTTPVMALSGQTVRQ